MWEHGNACKQAVLPLGIARNFDEVFSEVDAIDGPIFHLVVFGRKLPRHGLNTVLGCQFTLA